MRPVTDVPTLLASVALGASALLLGAAVVGALTADPAAEVEAVPVIPVEVEPVPAGAEEPPAAAGTEEGAAGPGIWEDGLRKAPESGEAMLAAVELDPFSPGRRPPPTRYRLPGAPEPMVDRPEPERSVPEAPDFRVVGAAVIGQGGAALVHTDGGGPPRLLSVGESLMGYTLAAVDGESATLVGPAGRLVLQVTRGQMAAAEQDSGDRRRRGDDDDRRREAQMERQRMLQMRAIMQQVQAAQRRRGGGGAP